MISELHFEGQMKILQVKLMRIEKVFWDKGTEARDIMDEVGGGTSNGILLKQN